MVTLREWRVPLLVACCWTITALATYTPFAPARLAILDFSEFLPLLRDNDSFLDRWSDLIQYFRTRGRASVSTYGLIALNYGVWQENAVGRQDTRVIQLAVGSI